MNDSNRLGFYQMPYTSSIYGDGSGMTGWKLPNLTATGAVGGNMGKGIYEVAILQTDDDGNTTLVFGPKAYYAPNESNAVAQAAVESQNKIDEGTVFKTRFFG